MSAIYLLISCFLWGDFRELAYVEMLDLVNPFNSYHPVIHGKK